MNARTVAGILALLSLAALGCGSSDDANDAPASGEDQHPAWLVAQWSHSQTKTSPYVERSYTFNADGSGEDHYAAVYLHVPSYYPGSTQIKDDPFRWTFEAPNVLKIDGSYRAIEIGPSCTWLTIDGLKLRGNSLASRAGCPNVGPALTHFETSLLGTWDFREYRAPDGGGRLVVKGTFELSADRVFSWSAYGPSGNGSSLWGAFTVRDGVFVGETFDDSLVVNVKIDGNELEVCDNTGCLEATRRP